MLAKLPKSTRYLAHSLFGGATSSIVSFPRLEMGEKITTVCLRKPPGQLQHSSLRWERWSPLFQTHLLIRCCDDDDGERYLDMSRISWKGSPGWDTVSEKAWASDSHYLHLHPSVQWVLMLCGWKHFILQRSGLSLKLDCPKSRKTRLLGQCSHGSRWMQGQRAAPPCITVSREKQDVRRVLYFSSASHRCSASCFGAVKLLKWFILSFCFICKYHKEFDLTFIKTINRLNEYFDCYDINEFNILSVFHIYIFVMFGNRL